MIEKTNEINTAIDRLLNSIFMTYENANYFSTFKETFSTYNGGAYKSKEYLTKSKFKLITIKNIDDNGFNTNSVDFINPANIINGTKLIVGDILLTMTGNIGRVGIVDEENCLLNQRVLKIICKSKSYCYCYLKKYQQDIIQLGRGTAQKNLSLFDLNNLLVHNSISEIICYQKYDSLFDMLLQNKLKIKKAQNLKSYLLSKYF